MDDFFDETWYDERWQSMSPVMRKVAADAIKKVLDEDTIELIKRKHAEHGPGWIHYLMDLEPDDQEFWGSTTLSGHHGWGTDVRNLLRNPEGGNIQDNDLPDAPYENGGTQRNWDDYYVAAIEAAVGLREV